MDDKKVQTEAARKFLAATFLGSLPPEAIDALIKYSHIGRYAKGTTLFERGDAGDSLMLIVSGSVKISNVTADAREVVLNFLGNGDILGEIAVLDGGPRAATATTLEETSVLRLYRRDLLPVLRANPDALLEIVAVLCQKLRSTSEIVEDALRNMSGRFAAGLLRLARQHGRRTARGIEIDLAVGQRDLGNYLGLSRENTSRQINGLALTGVLKSTNGVLFIVDESALMALAAREGQ